MAPPVGVLLRRLAEGGTAPDLIILSAEVVNEVERKGWARMGSAVALGSVGVGVAVKADTPLPNISSPEAMRRPGTKLRLPGIMCAAS